MRTFHLLSLKLSLLLHDLRNKIFLSFFCMTCEAFMILAPQTLATSTLHMYLKVYTLLSHRTSCVALMALLYLFTGFSPA